MLCIHEYHVHVDALNAPALQGHELCTTAITPQVQCARQLCGKRGILIRNQVSRIVALRVDRPISARCLVSMCLIVQALPKEKKARRFSRAF